LEIRDFQEMMRRIYYERDSSRGIAETFMWFIEEVGELARAIRDGNRRLMESEFADVFAWLASLANLVEINLDEAVSSKYQGVCPRCRRSPCVCSHRERKKK